MKRGRPFEDRRRISATVKRETKEKLIKAITNDRNTNTLGKVLDELTKEKK